MDSNNRHSSIIVSTSADRLNVIDAVNQDLYRQIDSTLPPSTAEFHIQMGQFQAQFGKLAEATESFREAVRLAPRDPSVYLSWIGALGESPNLDLLFDLTIKAASLMEIDGLVDSARKLLENMLASFAETAGLRSKIVSHLANLEIRRNRLASANAILLEVGDDSDDNPTILLAQARVHMLWGEHATAEQYVNAALSIAEAQDDSSSQSIALATKARLLDSLGQPNTAQKMFEEAIGISRSPHVLAEYANHIALFDELEQAVRFIDEAVTTEPTDPDIRLTHLALTDGKSKLLKVRNLLAEWNTLIYEYEARSQVTCEKCQHVLDGILQLHGCSMSSPLAAVAMNICMATVDVSGIFDSLSIQRNIPFAIFHSRWDERDFDVLLKELTRKRERYIVVVLLGDEVQEPQIKQRFRVHAIHLGVLTSLSVCNILVVHSNQLLKHLLLRQFEISRLSPYQTSGPETNPDMFVGREREMAWIHANVKKENIAIIGGRQIGKSTMLLQMRKSRNYQPAYQVYYCDMQNCTNMDDVRRVLQDGMMISPDHSYSRRSFTELFNHVCTSSGPHPVILIDEVDKLIEIDKKRGFPFFRSARAFSQSGKCHFVICGERALQSEIYHAQPKSPLHNFCQIQILERLERDAVHELSTAPMQQLGIEIEDASQLVDVIWNHTSGHPLLVQWICAEAVNEIEKSRVRLLATHHILDIVNGQPYIERFVATVLLGATLLERICILTLLGDPTIDNEADLFSNITQHGVRSSRFQLSDALARLESLRGLLRRSNQGITITMPALLTIYKCKNTDYELKKWIELYAQEGDVDPSSVPFERSFLGDFRRRMRAFILGWFDKEYSTS